MKLIACLLSIAVFIGCSSDNSSDTEVDTVSDAGVRCRSVPVRDPDCFNAFNVRACFYCPEEE